MASSRYRLSRIQAARGESVRAVPVRGAASRRAQEAQEAEHLVLGGSCREQRPGVRSSIGTPIEPRNVNRRWDELRRKAGMGRAPAPSFFATDVLSFLQVSRIASDASFGTSREHALPAAQRAALRRPRPAGAPCGYGDLGLHGPPGSDATMMRLMPLRGVHHRCACRHRDASGSSRRIGCIIGGPGERRPAGTAAARDAPGLRIIGHVTRLTWQPAALVAPHASPRPETDVPAAASSPVSHAARRRAAMPRTWLARVPP